MDWLSVRSPALYCWSFCFTTSICLIRLLHLRCPQSRSRFGTAARSPVLWRFFFFFWFPGFIFSGQHTGSPPAFFSLCFFALYHPLSWRIGETRACDADAVLQRA